MAEQPEIRIVRGIPTAEELAALVGVLALRSVPGAPAPAPAVSHWARSARPGARTAGWRGSALPG